MPTPGPSGGLGQELSVYNPANPQDPVPSPRKSQGAQLLADLWGGGAGAGTPVQEVGVEACAATYAQTYEYIESRHDDATREGLALAACMQAPPPPPPAPPQPPALLLSQQLPPTPPSLELSKQEQQQWQQQQMFAAMLHERMHQGAAYDPQPQPRKQQRREYGSPGGPNQASPPPRPLPRDATHGTHAALCCPHSIA